MTAAFIAQLATVTVGLLHVLMACAAWLLLRGPRQALTLHLWAAGTLALGVGLAASGLADGLIDTLLKARSREEFVTAVRAYDRVLLSGFYVVPLYYQPQQWLARWADVKHPDKTSIYGATLPTFWREAK